MAAIRTQQEIRQRAPLLLIGLLVANFLVMAFDAKDATTKQRKARVWLQTLAYPFQEGGATVGGAGVSFFQRLGQMRHAQQENLQLKELLTQREEELRQIQLERNENARLKQLLDLKQSGAYPVVIARVIGRDPVQWFRNITINAGTNSGVEVNMPVLADGSLVGRIVVAGPFSSQAMLLTDEKSAAGAVIGQISESGALGSVKGGGQNDLLEMYYVPGMVEVQGGETVLTTGQDKIYPPGLIVGTIAGYKQHGTATSPHVIYVRPAARLYALTNVAVALYHPPQKDESNSAKPVGAVPSATPASWGAVKVFGSPTPSPTPAPR